MSNGRTQNSIRNIAYKMTYQMSSVLLKFISRTIFIQVLGVEYLGINGLFTEVLKMLSLADLGLETAMVYSLYQPLAEENKERIAQLIQMYKRIYTVIAVTVTAIGIAIIPLLKYIVNLDQDIPHIYLYYVLYLLNTVSQYLVVYKTSILTADQKNYLLSKYYTIFDMCFTVAGIIVLLMTHSYMGYLITQVVFTYIKNFYCSHVADKTYPYLSMKVPQTSREENKNIFKNMGSVFLYKLSSTLVTSTDNTLISIIVGTIAVGYYSNYNMIVSNILVIINILFTSMTASIGNMIIENDGEKNYRVFRIMQQISFIISAIAISCVFVLIDDFITIWLGAEYTFDPIVVLAIVGNMFFSVVLMPLWSFRDATGMYQKTKFVMVGTAAVNLVMSVILGNIMGIAGILFASSIARLTTYFWYEPKLLFSEYFHQGVGNYYMRIAKNIILTVVITVILFLAFRSLVPIGWISLIGKMILVGISALILTILGYVRTPEFAEIRKMAVQMLHRRGKKA